MAYNPYGGNPYGAPPNYNNPYPGANPMGFPGSAPPPGMSPAQGMVPPPGVHQPPSASTQANRPSGISPFFQPPPNMPNINFNAPVIRLGGAAGPPTGPMNGMGPGSIPGAPTGPSGASSLPARPNLPHGGFGGMPPTGPGGRREPETPQSATSNGPPMMRPDFRPDRTGIHADRLDRFDRFDRGDHHGPRGGDHFERGGRGDRERADRGDHGRGDRGPGGNNLEQTRAVIRDNMHAHAPPTNDEKLRTIFVHKVPDGVGGEAALERLMGLVGRLRRWESARSRLSEHRDTLFGFAQYDDVDSLASAIALLKHVKVPLKKQEPKDHATPSTNGLGSRGSKDKDKDDAKADDKASGGANAVDDSAMQVDKDKGNEADNAETEDSPKKEGDTEAKKEKDSDGDESESEEDEYADFETVPLQIAFDPVSLQYIEAYQEKQSDEAKAEAAARRAASRKALRAAVHDLFYPPAREVRADVAMADAGGAGGGTGADGGAGDSANAAAAQQEDELADVPAEMREMVASEIASFRERSTQRDMERLKREQEMEELERRRNGDDAGPRYGRLDGPSGGASASASASATAGSNGVPLGPRNGGDDAHHHRHRRATRDDDPDTDASDEELQRREQRRQHAEDDKQYQEAERKWANRERQRAAALERERERERTEADRTKRHRAEALERDRTWDDEREAARKTVLYYRDHAAWLRKRAHERAEEEARDAADRRAEQDEQRRQAAEMEAARGLADSFLEQQAAEMGEREAAAAKTKVDKDGRGDKGDKETNDKAMAPQRVTISFGAAAQRNQAQRGGVGRRRTVAEVEGLLDDEEQDGAVKRQLVPIKFEPMSAAARMSDEEINQAVRALAQEIPTDKAGLWAWPVAWASMEKDPSIVRDKLRPFVEKKVVEYLGVQEQFLVEVVEEHLRQHGSPAALVEELQEALDEAAEDLVKKLWRMVIFFTESEKRGLPV